MGLGNGNPKSGNKGSNYAYELKTVRALSEIISSIKTLNPSGGGVPGVPLATESTLISVLNAIVASDQDIEILLVRDTGNADQVVQQITNYQTGVPVVTYQDVDGNPYVPVGPLEYLDPSAVMNLMLTELIAINANTAGGGSGATEATQLLVKTATQASAPKPNTLVSVKTTLAGLIPLGSKAATIYIEGPGGQVNSVIRPDGWSQSFEFNNDTLPAITFNGNNTATMYVDILT
jgi:hypothetical protein